MSDPRLAELAARLISGTLTADEERELTGLVSDDPAARAEIARHLFLDRVLEAVGHKPDEGDRLMAALPLALPAPRRFRPLAVAGAGLALAAAAAMVLVWAPARRPAPGISDPPVTAEGPGPASAEGLPGPPGEAPARAPAPEASGIRIAAVRGVVHGFDGQRRTAARAGEDVAPGRWLAAAGAASEALLELGDGATLRLDGGAVLGISGPAGDGRPGLFLSIGRAELRAPAGATGFSLFTPHLQIASPVGRTAITVQAAATRVEVIEGRTTVRSHRGDFADLQTAQSALVAQDAPIAKAATRGEALFATGPDERLAGDDTEMLSAADRKVKERLEQLGFRVRVERPSGSALPDLAGVALVLVSSTVAAKSFEWNLREVPIPLIVWEPFVYHRLGMVDGEPETDFGGIDGVDTLMIKDLKHPLAAGLTAGVQVTTVRTEFSWGAPGLFAAWVAGNTRSQTKMSLFAYERGARMPGGVAPARRVGFFFRGQTVNHLTEAGWLLFDAAVRWSVEP